jgi:hypothetical protein
MAEPTPLHPPSPAPEATPSPQPTRPADTAAARSSRASSSAPTSRAAGLFIGDPGPAFDADQAAREPAPELAAGEPPLVADALPAWEEDAVRSILTAQGNLVHGVAGVAEDDWIYLQHELDAIAPPLTRILNRVPALRAAAEAGDGIAVMIGLGGYTVRSYTARRAELQAQAQEQLPEPVTGVAAPPGTGPEPQEVPTWQT